MNAANAITARAPTRLDFGGGWTDVPPYTTEEGGFVCNVAIRRYATVRLQCEESTARESEPLSQPPLEPLVAAAARLARLGSVRITVQNDFPLGAGLGGSSAAGVAMAAAIRAWRGEALEDVDRDQLARDSRRIEVEELGVPGGWQDHYAAAFGGALALSFGDATLVERIPLTPATIEALERRCVVAYSGHSRISGSTITAVLGAFGRREARVTGALAGMKAIARSMAAALAAGDVDALGTLTGEQWVHQRALHPTIPTPLIDAILARGATAGALGGKALGASGGGCVLLVARDGREEELRAAVAELAELLPYRIDVDGVVVNREEASHAH